MVALLLGLCACDAPKTGPGSKNGSTNDPKKPTPKKWSLESCLTQVIENNCRSADEPWAAVHGSLGLGRDFQLEDKRNAIVAAATDWLVVKDGRAQYPAFSKKHPVSPHPGLFLKVSLELGQSLDGKPLKAKGYSEDKLIQDILQELDLNRPLSNQEWLLEVLFYRGPKDLSARACEQALRLLEAEQAYIESYAKRRGKTIQSFQKKYSVQNGQRRPAAIHRYFCGGTHLFQAVLTGAKQKHLGADGVQRLAKQVKLLLYRGRAEGIYWDRVMTQTLTRVKDTEKQSNLIDLFLSQKLKILGHCLEVWQKCRLWQLYKADKEDEKDIEAILKDLENTVKMIDDRGLFGQLDKMKDQPAKKQLRQDLIGDSGHALYALRLAKQSSS